MTRLVVDASVAVKWFVPEIHTDAAARLLDPGVQLWAPDLIGPELSSTLWKKSRRSELTRDEATEINRAFATSAVEIAPSGPLLAGALQIAFALDRNVYDSLYLVLAIALDCELVTADRRFHGVIAASALANHITWIADVR